MGMWRWKGSFENAEIVASESIKYGDKRHCDCDAIKSYFAGVREFKIWPIIIELMIYNVKS